MSLVLRPGMPRASLDFLSLINEHPTWRLSVRGQAMLSPETGPFAK